MIITNNTYTAPARKLAKENQITLIERLSPISEKGSNSFKDVVEIVFVLLISFALLYLFSVAVRKAQLSNFKLGEKEKMIILIITVIIFVSIIIVIILSKKKKKLHSYTKDQIDNQIQPPNLEMVPTTDESCVNHTNQKETNEEECNTKQSELIPSPISPPTADSEEVQCLKENLMVMEQRLKNTEAELEAQLTENEKLLNEVQMKSKQKEHVNESMERLVKENNKIEYDRLLDDFIAYVTEYVNYYFELEEIAVSVINVYANQERKSVIVELSLGQGVSVGKIRYRLGSLADYLNVKYVKITSVVSDMTKLGLEVSYPRYLCYYQE